ncbi:MAG TPA: glycine zipper domain-containing protein [Ferruginibacter sp.]|nr:glycine zipper domain-containing protein [Ferruginibacter sp.]
MKRILGIVAIAGTLVACKGNKTNTTATTLVLSAADSAKMKEFEQWKDKKEQSEKTTVIYRDKPAAKTDNIPATSTEYTTTADNANTTEAAPVTEKKKGWSKAAKGAVIGGVTGAAAGAIITKKNRAAGAVIGGAVGAGVGYGIGRAKDRKDGRY